MVEHVEAVKGFLKQACIFILPGLSNSNIKKLNAVLVILLLSITLLFSFLFLAAVFLILALIQKNIIHLTSMCTQDDYFSERPFSICLHQFSNNLCLKELREFYSTSWKVWSYVFLANRSFAFDYYCEEDSGQALFFFYTQFYLSWAIASPSLSPVFHMLWQTIKLLPWFCFMLVAKFHCWVFTLCYPCSCGNIF